MQYVFDGCIILAMILFTVIGIKKGVVKSITEFIGAIAAAFVSSWLAGIASTWIFDTFFRQGLLEKITAATQNVTGETIGTRIFGDLPDFIVRLLEMSGITADTINNSIAASGKDIALAVTNTISPVFISIIKVFAVIIIFLILMFIVKAIAGLLSGIFQLPVLRQINGLLGGVFGFLFGTVIIWIVIGGIQFFKPMMDSKMQEDLQKTIDSSYVAKIVIPMNPIKWIFE